MSDTDGWQTNRKIQMGDVFIEMSFCVYPIFKIVFGFSVLTMLREECYKENAQAKCGQSLDSH